MKNQVIRAVLAGTFVLGVATQASAWSVSDKYSGRSDGLVAQGHCGDGTRWKLFDVRGQGNSADYCAGGQLSFCRVFDNDPNEAISKMCRSNGG